VRGLLCEGEVCVVTGANAGIGLETARALARLGATVVLTSRDRARGEAAKDDIGKSAPGAALDLVALDLASLASVRAAAAEIAGRHARIDVLVNNAGVYFSHRAETRDGLEMTFGVNHLGPFLFTCLLLDRLRAAAPARIVNVASHEHTRTAGLDFDDLQATRGYSGIAAYRRSKLANVLFTRELARRLAGSGVTANALHPGSVRTQIGRDGDARGLHRLFIALASPFLIGPERGARTSVFVATSPEIAGVSGRYFARCRERAPSRPALDDAAARRLWDESARLVGYEEGGAGAGAGGAPSTTPL
jgi:NAD(P)-dependent dehydrogenase (short-subunit alcohol dehydrogenase family)